MRGDDFYTVTELESCVGKSVVKGLCFESFTDRHAENPVLLFEEAVQDTLLLVLKIEKRASRDAQSV